MIDRNKLNELISLGTAGFYGKHNNVFYEDKILTRKERQIRTAFEEYKVDEITNCKNLYFAAEIAAKYSVLEEQGLNEEWFDTYYHSPNKRFKHILVNVYEWELYKVLKPFHHRFKLEQELSNKEQPKKKINKI